MDRWPPLSVLPWLFGWGLVTAIPFVSLPDPSGASAAAWASAIFVVLGPTVGSYWLNLFALRTLPASVVALFIYLQPFLAAGLAYGVLGERPTGRIGLAAALAFAGVWLASRAPRDDKSRRTDPGATG
jgi:drug/metabolite transporter (DMT)-like permease